MIRVVEEEVVDPSGVKDLRDAKLRRREEKKREEERRMRKEISLSLITRGKVRREDIRKEERRPRPRRDESTKLVIFLRLLSPLISLYPSGSSFFLSHSHIHHRVRVQGIRSGRISPRCSRETEDLSLCLTVGRGPELDITRPVSLRIVVITGVRSAGARKRGGRRGG